MAKNKKRKNVNLPEDEELNSRWTEGIPLSPSWWAPVFVTLLIVGLAWLVIFYFSGGRFPIPNIGNANMLIGIAFMLAGFAMTLRWR